jgi:CTP:molybdopterin cytidylyltransferase MocA
MIGDRPMLQWVVDQLRHCKDLDDIVLATVAEAENRPLQDFAEKNGMPCFWYQGEVEHVTTRLRRAAEAFDADVCVLVSGDCPLIHAPAIDQLIRSLKDSPVADTVGLLPDCMATPRHSRALSPAGKKHGNWPITWPTDRNSRNTSSPLSDCDPIFFTRLRSCCRISFTCRLTGCLWTRWRTWHS